MIVAAGTIILTPQRQVLLLRRSADSDHPNTWAFPGGKAEQEDEGDLRLTAARETLEEIGKAPKPDQLRFLMRSHGTAGDSPPAVPAGGAGAALHAEAPPADAQVDFTTYLWQVPEQFTPTLCAEHTAWLWADADDPGVEGLHPGAALALRRLGMDELGVARAMAAGELESPQKYDNVTLWNMRVTGTGKSYRAALKEHVWRDPAIYMNDEFLARCNGLPVIMEHPQRATLDSDEFSDRIVGTVFLPYLVPEAQEVWAVVKIYDDATNKMMSESQLSTSPSVVFRDPSVNTKEKLKSGETLLIEGKPSLLDHLAICEQGVWDKGGEPTGIETTINDSTGGTEMAEETKNEERMDADAGEKLDKVLEGLKTMGARMDAIEARYKDAEEDEEKSDGPTSPQPKQQRTSEDEEAIKKFQSKAKGDAEEDEEPAEEDEPKRVAADKRRKDAKSDAEEDEEEEREDEDEEEEREDEDEEEEEAKADSVARHYLTKHERRIRDLERAMPRDVSDKEYRAMADAQAKADPVYQAFGDAAPRPLQGEDLLGYRRRLARGLKKHSPRWSNVNLSAVADQAAFDNIEEGIYNDAMATARSPVDVPLGQLREITSSDRTGRQITEFAGEPISWMGNFGGNRRRLVGVRQQ